MDELWTSGRGAVEEPRVTSCVAFLGWQLLTARGNELAFECTEEQLIMLSKLGEQANSSPYTSPPKPPPATPIATASNASVRPRTSSRAAERDGLRLHLDYRIATLTLRSR